MSPTHTLVLLMLQATLVGCVTNGKPSVVKHVAPVLSDTLSCEELVDYLNAQNEGLHGWRCMNTQVVVSMPGVPLPQTLNGELSCVSPTNFRLTASNFVGMADFGSNEDICWAYSKPGEPAVMTWDHEDSHLLEFVPGNFPRLDPEWLMVILGIQPLDARDFHLQKPPAGSRELWLVAIEESASGQSLRRVIQVDTARGVPREHALIDHNGATLLRAQLTNHRTCGGHILPYTVKISFPPQKTELTLKFKNIEPNCRIADGLWTPPGGDRIARIDLGDYVRRNRGDIPPKRAPRGESMAQFSQQDRMIDGSPPRPGNERIEPEFDVVSASDEALFSDPGFVSGRPASARPADERFFVPEDQDEFDPTFDDSFESKSPDPVFDSRAPIRETGFREEPDFDIVAPVKSKPRWFEVNR